MSTHTGHSDDGAMTLDQALRRAAEQLQAQQPPPGLKAQVSRRVQAALRQARPPATPSALRSLKALRHGVWTWSVGLVAGGVLLATALLMLRLPTPAVVVDEGTRYGAFVPIAPADQWPPDTAPAWLVRTELQAERLAALGLPYDPARAGDSVRAELLMRSSGEVLAVRFVR